MNTARKEIKYPEYHDAPTEGVCSFIAETAVGYFVISTSYVDKEGLGLGPFATMKEAQAELSIIERHLTDAGATEQLLN
jgi:hypothetical protein